MSYILISIIFNSFFSSWLPCAPSFINQSSIIILQKLFFSHFSSQIGNSLNYNFFGNRIDLFFTFITQLNISFNSMTDKAEGEQSTSIETGPQNAMYIDTAYKQLLRQQLKANALKNRTKALNINQEHILKQVQNNQCILQKLTAIKSLHAEDVKMLSKDKQKKIKITEQQKHLNQIKRVSHEKQMSTIIHAQSQERDKIREQARKMRKQNQILIDKNREQEQAKKRQIRNKIHDDIMQSRTTIKNFFTNKHDRIVLSTQQEVKKINQKRAKQEMLALTLSGKVVEEMQSQMKEMKNTLRDSRVGFQLKRQQSRLTLNRKGESHPLVHKIDEVMNTYTKVL